MAPCKSFVCDLCKSAHQSFSHRVKSVTMSNWTLEEVKVLETANGGGNAATAAIWQGGLPGNQTGKPNANSSDLNAMKRYVQRVYIDKAFYNPNAQVAAAAPQAQQQQQQQQ